jgi:hypothetical protein
MHASPLLLTMLMLILQVVVSVILDRTYIEFDGHVLCRTGDGKPDVPVKNAEVIMMEEDRWFLI